MTEISALKTDLHVDWHVSPAPIAYPEAVKQMQSRATAIAQGTQKELIWLLEHPPLYTAGTSAQAQDLIAPERFEVHRTSRGGQYTYHGPGQRIAYVMLDLRQRGRSVAALMHGLEQWLINVLAHFEVIAERKAGRVGVWVTHDDGREEKIAAMGLRLRKWVSYHGISLNIAPDLSHFSGIVPCGIAEHGVTSLKALGKCTDMAAIDGILRQEFEALFSPTQLSLSRPID